MRLAFDGIAGLIGMVETMHGNIAGQFGAPLRWKEKHAARDWFIAASEA